MRKCFGVLIAALLITGSLWADERGPSTPAERQRALTVIQALEQDPVSPALAQDREWVNHWILEVPDIQVSICTSIIKPLLEEKNTDPRRALQLQNLLAMAAFKMQSPDRADDPIQVQMAGAEGMIRAYANIVQRMPAYKSEFMESLKSKKRDGTLEAYVRLGASECRARGAGTVLRP